MKMHVLFTLFPVRISMYSSVHSVVNFRFGNLKTRVELFIYLSIVCSVNNINIRVNTVVSVKFEGTPAIY